MSSACFLTAAEASCLIHSGQLSPVELVESFIARVADVDEQIRSYITFLPEQALAAARLAETEIRAGRSRGPLHGLPYGLKDNIFTAGIRTTAASRLMIDFVPDKDAAVHRRLQEAGAILLGKLNTYEYGTGTGAVHFDLAFPPARNPWNLDHFTGGSSTGAGAGVAAATVMFAIGTDTGGSIRLPASGCGLAGLKPTYGLVSRAGMQANCWTLDHVGPIAWNAEDAALVLQVIAGYDAEDPASHAGPVPDYTVRDTASLAGIRVGILRRFHEQDIQGDPDVGRNFETVIAALRSLGAELVELQLHESLQNFRSCLRIINVSESFSIHERVFFEHHAQMGRALREKMMAGMQVSAADYMRAQRWRRTLANSVDALFDRCDIVLSVGSPRPAPRFDQNEAVAAFTYESSMSTFSLSGHPALAICSGFSQTGLPTSLQLAGRYWNEALVLRAGAAVERALQARPHRPLSH